MKYRQLTKEQFEDLHIEFANFLASQSIDKKEWEELKKNKPNVADDEMNIFSDVVWDDVLNRIEYLEHFSEQSINLFKCYQEELMPYTNDGMRCRAQHYLPPRPVTPVNAAIGRRPQLLHR